jgi:hypothetical protein
MTYELLKECKEVFKGSRTKIDDIKQFLKDL